MQQIVTDLRYAVRTLVRLKGFTLVAVATLGLGIAATTTVFSVVDAVLLRKLPVKDPDELVIFHWLRRPDPVVAAYSGYGRPGPGGTGIRTSFSILTLERFREHSATMASVFAIAPVRDASLTADGQNQTVSAELVSASYFQSLGVPAIRGRTFLPSDDRADADAVAVISHRYWQRRFDQDPAVIGKSVFVNRTPVTIVGVTPPGFHGTRISESIDVVLPLALASSLAGARPTSLWWMQIMGRLRQGVTPEQALAELQPLFSETVRESWSARPPSSDQKGTSFPELRLASGSQGFDGPRRDAVPLLAASLAVAAAVLLIACVNVGNLVLARTLSRRHELAVRMAVGASRGRVMRQMLTEGLVLALMGAAVGTFAAFWGGTLFSWLPSANTLVVDARLDLPVLVCAMALTIVATTILCIGPALRAARSTLAPHAHVYPRTRSVVRRSLVVLQVSVTLVLLVAGSLLLETLSNLGRIDPGFDSRNLLVFRIDANHQDSDRTRAFQRLEDIREALMRVPGVESPTMSTMPILAQAEWTASVTAESGGEPRSAYIQGVGPAFFETLGIVLVKGRRLTTADREGSAKVAVINESMARQVFSTTDPIGRRFRFVEGPDRDVAIEVVGVVRDVAYARVEESPPPTFYRPYRQLPTGPMSFAVRTAVDPLTVVSAVTTAVRQVDPRASLAALKTLDQQILETVALPRALAIVTTASALVGLSLACLGLYGLVSFDVARKTREIAIRVALGASRAGVVKLVVGDAFGVVLVGTTVGLAAAVPAAIAARKLLFGVSLANPFAVLAAVALLALAAGLAAYLPARRACSLDPTTALRVE